MNLKELRLSMKEDLRESRYLHSIGVEETALDLALIHGYDTNKASIAGILHDCAKNISDQELLRECEKYHIPVSDIENKCIFLLHAKVGAMYAREKFGIKDDEIFNAIWNHTTGHPGMSLLEKIIFTADYIEPYRRPLPRINEIRLKAYNDLDQAVYMILENTLKYLFNSGAIIDPVTIDTYHYYKNIALVHE